MLKGPPGQPVLPVGSLAGCGRGRTGLAPGPGPFSLAQLEPQNKSLPPGALLAQGHCPGHFSRSPWTQPLRFGAVPIYHGQVPSDPAPIPGHFLTMVSLTQTSGRRARNVRSSEELAWAPRLSCPGAGWAGGASLTALVPRTGNVGSTCVCAGVCARTCVHVCARTLCSLGWAQGAALPAPGGPPLGKAPTFRETPSSESLLQRALRGLASSSASLGSSRSVPREVPSARRSVPTSRRPSRCSAEPSSGRIWAEAQGSRLPPRRGWWLSPRVLPAEGQGLLRCSAWSPWKR